MRLTLLRARRASAAPAALCLAVALVVVPATAQSDRMSTPITMKVRDRSVVFGHAVVVTGHVAGAGAGQTVTLQHRPRGGQWQAIRDVTTDASGRFVILAVLPSTGAVRVVTGGAGARVADAAAPPEATSAARVAVAADVVERRKRMNVLAGRGALVTGVVRPGVAGQSIALQRRSAHGWTTVARAATRVAGRFTLRFRPRRPLSALLRLRVAASQLVAAAHETVGRLNVFRRAYASWYGPGFFGHGLGCGGTLTPGTLGVANKSLPCGKPLTLRLGKRIVRVRVIDRGPYVSGREFDLTSATKDRLGFAGVGLILVTA
jgi:rare lipoprotein A